MLNGSSPPRIEHLLEIRGVRLLNFMTIIGAGSGLNSRRITCMVQLECRDDKKQYERLGIDEATIKSMDVHVPKAITPVRLGRNLAVIIEVAAMNCRLKKMGVNAAAEFSNQLSTMINERGTDADEMKQRRWSDMGTCEAEALNKEFIQGVDRQIEWQGLNIDTEQ